MWHIFQYQNANLTGEDMIHKFLFDNRTILTPCEARSPEESAMTAFAIIGVHHTAFLVIVSMSELFICVFLKPAFQSGISEKF
jgi:hypothetical protein